MSDYYIKVIDAKRSPCSIPLRCLEKRHIGFGSPPMCDDCGDVLQLLESTSSTGAPYGSPVDVPIFLDLIQRCPALGDFEVTAVPRGATVVSTLQRALREYASKTRSKACSKALDLARKTGMRIRRLWAIIPKRGGNLPSVLIPALLGTLIFEKDSPTTPIADVAFIERNSTHPYPLKHRTVLWFPYGDESMLDEYLARHMGMYLHVKSFEQPQGRINISDDGRGIRSARLRAVVQFKDSKMIIEEGDDRWGRAGIVDLLSQSSEYAFDIGNPKQRRMTIGATFEDFHANGVSCPLVSPGNRYFCDYWYLTGFIDLWDIVLPSDGDDVCPALVSEETGNEENSLDYDLDDVIASMSVSDDESDER